MGHDEDKNNFSGGTAPVDPASVTPNPRANIAKNRIGMRPARDFSAKSVQAELDRISGVTPQTQPTGGDIILNNGSNKKSNKKSFVAVAIVLLCVCSFVVIAILLTRKVGINTDVVDKNNFISTLLNGDNNIQTYITKKENATLEDYSNGEDLIYPFIFYNMSSYSSHRDKKIEQYFDGLDEKYSLFKTENSESKKIADIEKLGNLIYIMKNSVNYERKIDDIIGIYLNDKSHIKEYFENNFKDYDISSVKEVVFMQKAFYDIVLQNYSLYDSVGCLKNRRPDYDCVIDSGRIDVINTINKSNSEIDTSFRMMARASNSISNEIVKILNSIW